ncbi:MAG: ABC transporter ATP-binding protein [Chloroflexi bacterium]|nr:ABC transporter ATP-binding protein [Chloroflexota bacterium]
MSALRLLEVSKQFGGVAALSRVTLAVPEGTIYGLIGPNGAGKSTLFNLINGIYPVSAGRIFVGERDVTGWRPAAIARLGVARTFQSIHLFAGMTVLDNVLMGQSRFAHAGLLSLVPVLADRREAALRREALHTLEWLELAPYAEANANELPYAIQRRVEVARALASSPRLLLLDEPAAGCNEEESRALAADIRRIRERGITVVLIEHDMSVVMEVCDRIAVLNFGEVIAEGTPEEIQNDPLVLEAYLGREDDVSAAAAHRGLAG